ncbi:MAG: trypsin-like serine protease [Labilithrix sp.]|nr:trypsin-like serine protease [Labilithrix sp.]
MKLSLGAVLVFAAFAAGCAAPAAEEIEEEATAGEDALIGGKPATVADFPATLYLKDGCTAAKVAPKRVLTAAHCVVDPATVSIVYPAGAKLALARDGKSFVEHEVAAVHVHPSWMRACEETYCASSSATALMDAADVAVIELTRDLDGVPEAAIDPAPLAPGDAVVVLGFGCTEGVLAPDAHGRSSVPRSLAYADTRVVDARRAIHEGSPVGADALPRVTGSYAMTPGPAFGKGGSAGLCPGDSGGPLYRRAGGELLVAGINANYTLRPEAEDTVGLPVTNWHTRLDAKSRHGIASWLASVGVGRD